MSHGLNGGGPWKCAWHFTLDGSIDDQMVGAQVVLKSMEWDGTKEQYMEWRNAKHECAKEQAQDRAPEKPKNIQPRADTDPQHARTIAALGASILARSPNAVEQLEPGSNG